MPELFEVIVNTTEGIDHLPKPNVPHYVLAKEGMYLHRGTQIGSVLLREYKTPTSLQPTGYPNGVFLWEGPEIPGKIISQATDFFKRIFDKHGTEAEVLITMHNETREFRLFVPFQRTSHGGVKSIFEPTHIDKNYTIVGTLHSHCDFSAFHSGTDSADASDMDGVHFTIGMLKRDTPEIVAMVTMGGKQFHYKEPSTIAEIVWDADTAPLWWDQYIFPANTESQKPKSLKSLTQDQWNEFRGLATPKPKTQPNTTNATGWSMGDYGRYGYTPHGPSSWQPSEDKKPVNTAVDYINKYMGTISQPLSESKKFNKRRRHYNQPVWSMEGSLANYRTQEEILIDLALDDAETTNVINQDDYDGATLAQMASIEFWQLLFSCKIEAISDILDTLGMKVEYSIKPKDIKQPVTGQTALSDTLEF
jgi:proteasome lid subunit RPN8/RPN11